MSAPVEKTTKYATTVQDLPAAWAFVMGRVDSVGPDPSITISPVWVIGLDDEISESQRQFEVVVSGMVHAEGPDA